MKNIAVIGGGQIGSRHIQALTHNYDPLNLVVVEPSEKAQSICLQRFADMPGSNKHRFSLFSNIADISNEIDLAIIATSSRERKKALYELCDQKSCSYLILEKFLFPNIKDFSEVNHYFTKNHIKSWINCPLKTAPLYQHIRKSIQRLGEQPIKMSVQGTRWGLATNSVHFIDLFLSLTRSENIDLIDVDATGSIYPSKRSGYHDISGVARFATKNDSLLTLDSSDILERPLTVSIVSGTENWRIIDKGDYFDVSCSTRNINSYKVKANLQSEITHFYLNEILLSGTCSLPDFTQSTLHHIKVLKLVEKLRNNSTKDQISSEFTFT